MGLTLLTLHITQPTAQVPTGSVYLSVDAGSSYGPLTIEIPGITPGIDAMHAPATLPAYAYATSGIAPGTYPYTVYDAGPTHLPPLTGEFTINPAPDLPPPDPSVNDPARWEPVGGVLPNPVLLQVEAKLTDAAGVPRPGLHVEVELWRPAALAAFATFRATVREAVQFVDAAPYLRAQLVAAQRYPATQLTPLLDADAALRYSYRFRVVDSNGPDYWQPRAGERYAVLAALPMAADTMAPYVADTTGRVASIFPDGEVVQFVGCPLEVSVLLPPATVARYAEWRYLDAYGQQVEIRSYALPASVPAGMLRLPMPDNPLPHAATVQVSIIDTDRHTMTNPPLPGGYLLTDHGRLQL
ncbi:MAG: hypothetical protein ACRYFX_12955 [Janthinobacterium lividum]